MTAIVVLIGVVGVVYNNLSSKTRSFQESVSTLTSDESNEEKLITIRTIASTLYSKNHFSKLFNQRQRILMDQAKNVCQ